MFSLSTPPPVSPTATFTDATVSAEAKPITEGPLIPMTPISALPVTPADGTSTAATAGTTGTTAETATAATDTKTTTTTGSTVIKTMTSGTDAAQTAIAKRSPLFYVLIVLLIGIVIYGTWWIWSQLKTAPAA